MVQNNQYVSTKLYLKEQTVSVITSSSRKEETNLWNELLWFLVAIIKQTKSILPDVTWVEMSEGSSHVKKHLISSQYSPKKVT